MLYNAACVVAREPAGFEVADRRSWARRAHDLRDRQRSKLWVRLSCISILGSIFDPYTHSIVVEPQAFSTHRTVANQYGRGIRDAARSACLCEVAPAESSSLSDLQRGV